MSPIIFLVSLPHALILNPGAKVIFSLDNGQLTDVYNVPIWAEATIKLFFASSDGGEPSPAPSEVIPLVPSSDPPPQDSSLSSNKGRRMGRVRVAADAKESKDVLPKSLVSISGSGDG